MDLESLVVAIVVLCAGLGTKLLVDRRRAARRADASHGIEIDRAERASYRTLPVAMILMAGLGLWLLVRGDVLGGLATYGTLALLIAAYWINDLILKRDER